MSIFNFFSIFDTILKESRYGRKGEPMEIKTYDDVLENARKVLAPKCRVCHDCNGFACKGEIPGVGGSGSGMSFIRAREYIKSVTINMDAVHSHYEADTSVELFGKNFSYPFFVAPIGGMSFNYTNVLSEAEYSAAAVKGALDSGIFAFTGDGPKDEIFDTSLPLIKDAGGCVISTIKPWEMEKCFAKIERIKEAGGMAFAMDIDSASLINLKLQGKPVYTKSESEIAELVKCGSPMPFIVKGIMTAKAAEACARAGAYGIVVSNHGGRVMADSPAPASKLREIRAAVGDSIRIFVDGGIRSGADVFKVLALGADAALIGRPYGIAIHGGGAEGVSMLTKRIGGQLEETMLMTGASKLSEISYEMINLAE